MDSALSSHSQEPIGMPPTDRLSSGAATRYDAHGAASVPQILSGLHRAVSRTVRDQSVPPFVKLGSWIFGVLDIWAPWCVTDPGPWVVGGSNFGNGRAGDEPCPKGGRGGNGRLVR